MDEASSRPLIQQALELGINFLDTANVYSDGNSEEIVGRAVRDFSRREDVVIATKLNGRMRPGPNGAGLSRRAVFMEIDNSLRRLGTDWVDLYQIHRWDPATPIEETLEALHDVVKAGKARYIGASSMYAWQFAKALYTSRLHGWTEFVSMQDHFNLLNREEEREMLPLCADQGIGVLPWSPLAGGWLTGRYRKGQEAPQSSRAQRIPGRYDLSTPENQRKLDAVEALAQLAEEAGLSMVHLAIAFTLAHPAVTSPIIGPRTMEQLESQLGAVDVVLTPDVLDRIDEIVPPGTTLSPADAGYAPPALTDAALRRR